MVAGLRPPSLHAWYACSITISTRTPRAARRSVRRTPIVVGCCAATLALGVLAFLATGADRQAPVVRRAYVRSFNGRALTNPFEIMAVQSDGQAYVALARDPLLRRPEEFPTRAEAAYRAQRPLLPWLAWASALGRPGLVPATLAVWQVLAFGLAGWAVASLLASRGGPAWAAPGWSCSPGRPSPFRGWAVWARGEDFTWPLLALHVFGLVAPMSPERRRDGREARR